MGLKSLLFSLAHDTSKQLPPWIRPPMLNLEKGHMSSVQAFGVMFFWHSDVPFDGTFDVSLAETPLGYRFMA